jgi:AbrB family looped-hinge helix DNA binding protein
MKEYTATLTKRGQVTIPADVQRLLNLAPGDKVRFVIDNGSVELTPTTFTLKTAFGSVKPRSGDPSGLDVDEQIRIVKEDRANEAIEALKRE